MIKTKKKNTRKGSRHPDICKFTAPETQKAGMGVGRVTERVKREGGRYLRKGTLETHSLKGTTRMRLERKKRSERKAGHEKPSP